MSKDMSTQKGLTIVKQMKSSLGHNRLKSLQVPFVQKKKCVCDPRVTAKQVQPS